VPELAEAAARTGDVALVRIVLEWLSERTRVSPTQWALGMEARVRALLSEGEAAGSYYQESIDRLGRTRIRAELARAHLLYGEWLRREHRRTEAREQLRTAHDMLDAMGIGAFAERAGRELAAVGETARKRPVQAIVQASEALTVQEAQVAQLARDGLSNPEIGARLFISSRTVQYHLAELVFLSGRLLQARQRYRVLTAEPRVDGPLGNTVGADYAGGPASARAVSSRETSLASAAPIRWKISRARRRKAAAWAAWSAARAQRPRPARACASLQ
jgi:DNA-binding CsgD family transcriptional regulator